MLEEQRLVRTGVAMDLGRTLPMNEESKVAWMEITAKHVRNEVRRQLQGNLVTIKVQVTPTEQTPPFLGNRRHLRQQRRLDQDEDNQLNILFDVEILLRSDVTEHDVSSYIGGAFGSTNDQQSYIVELRLAQVPAFIATHTVYVIVPDASPTPAPVPVSSGLNIGIIIGIVAVAVSGVGLAGFFLYTKRRRRRIRQEDTFKSPPNTDSSGNYSSQQHPPEGPYPNEFNVDSHDDISTLGDPLPPGMPHEQATDGSTVGPGSLGFDFRKTYGSGGDVGSGDLSGNHLEPVADDDGTLGAQYMEEIQFEIDAPAGMLGLVLESSAGDGVPVVHAIKPTSPLAKEVQVGDRLLSVDGQDVALRLASDVSRMISEKRDQPVRRFVFTRPQRPGMMSVVGEGGDHHDDDDDDQDVSFDSRDNTYNKEVEHEASATDIYNSFHDLNSTEVSSNAFSGHGDLNSADGDLNSTAFSGGDLNSTATEVRTQDDPLDFDVNGHELYTDDEDDDDDGLDDYYKSSFEPPSSQM